MADLAHVAARFLNTPLAITPEKLAAIRAFLEPRLGLVAPDVEAAAPMPSPRGPRPEYGVREGVAVLPIMGTIVKRNASGVMNASGAVSTEALTQTFRTAVSDPSVDAILLHLDSSGGEVSGTPDFAALVASARGQKPIWAMVDESAYSAAYWIAAACDRLVLPSSGGVGSIGVIAVHVDQSRALDALGVTPTVIKAGAHKDALSPLAPLSADARATLQAEVDRVFGLFTDAVAAYRGLKAEHVRGFEADTFQGANAVAAGLADAVGTFDDTFLELATMPRKPAPRPQRSHAMAAEDSKVVDLDEHRKALEAARAEGATAGGAAERARVAAITDMGTLAQLPAVAAECIAKGLTVDDARAALVNAQAAAAAAITVDPTQRPSASAPRPTIDSAAIYAQRAAKVTAKARERLTARV